MTLRRMYVQVALTLMVTTVALLLFVGSLTYFQLTRQLRADTATDLTSEVSEVEQVIRTYVADPDTAHPLHLDLADDAGQSTYYVVLHGSKEVVSSTRQPIPANWLSARWADHTEALRPVEYQGQSFLALSDDWSNGGVDYRLLVYRPLTKEQQFLAHTVQLLAWSGGIAVFAALIIHAWLSRRFMRPIADTWAAHKAMLVELSHELQTPLATISAITSSGVSDPLVRRELQREVSHASELVRDILYLSQLRGVPQEPGEPVAVTDVTEEVAERLGPLAIAGGVSLEGRADQGLYVRTSPDRWARLVSTLLKNAIDHAPSGSTAMWRLTAEDGQVCLTIRNAVQPANGRAESTGTRGFGLEIVRRLVDGMGGRFTIHSEGGEVIAVVQAPRLQSL